MGVVVVAISQETVIPNKKLCLKVSSKPLSLDVTQLIKQWRQTVNVT